MNIGKLIFLITVMYSSTSFACSCSGWSFQYTIEKTDVLSHVKISNILTNYNYFDSEGAWTDPEFESMTDSEKHEMYGEDFTVAVEADVLKKIKGADVKERIIVRLNDGCPSSFYIEHFVLGEEYIVALYKVEDRKGKIKRNKNYVNAVYALDVCSFPVAILKNNEVHSYKWMNFNEDERLKYFMKYDEFLEKFGT